MAKISTSHQLPTPSESLQSFILSRLGVLLPFVFLFSYGSGEILQRENN